MQAFLHSLLPLPSVAASSPPSARLWPQILLSLVEEEGGNGGLLPLPSLCFGVGAVVVLFILFLFSFRFFSRNTLPDQQRLIFAGKQLEVESPDNLQSSICRLFSYQPWLPVPQLHPTLTSPNSNNVNPNPNFLKIDFTSICALFRNPNILHGLDLESASRETKILPSPPLLEAVIDHFDSSPNLLFLLFKWAEKHFKFYCRHQQTGYPNYLCNYIFERNG